MARAAPQLDRFMALNEGAAPAYARVPERGNLLGALAGNKRQRQQGKGGGAVLQVVQQVRRQVVQVAVVRKAIVMPPAARGSTVCFAGATAQAARCFVL